MKKKTKKCKMPIIIPFNLTKSDVFFDNETKTYVNYKKFNLN